MASFKNLISTTSAQISSGGTITGDLVVDGDLQINGGGSLSFDEIVEGTQVIDITSTEAFLVRKNGDTGDLFTLDTTNSRMLFAGEMRLNDKDGDGTFGGRIRYDNSDNELRIEANEVSGDDVVIKGNDAIKFEDSGGTKMILDGGNLGIGETTPLSTLVVRGANAVNPSNGNGGNHTLQVIDTTTIAQGVGGGIAFGGNFVGTSETLFAEIRGIKENATSHDFDSALIFSTRIEGADITERMRITSDGKVAIGNTSADGTLHVHTATAGSTTANANADDLVVENSDHGGMTILTPDDKIAYIMFGDASDSARAGLQYYHEGVDSDERLLFNVAGGERMRLTAAGMLKIVQGTNFAASSNTTDNIYLNSLGASAGDGNYGASIGFSRASGGDNKKAAIVAFQDGSDADPTGLTFWTSSGTGTSADASEVMRITSDGKIGIGETSPTGYVHISPPSGNSPTMYFEQYTSATDGTLGEISFGNRAVDGQLALIQAKNDGANDSAFLAFHTEVTSGALTERMRITSAGNVGIGASSPRNLLHVYHASDDIIGLFQSGDAGAYVSFRDNSTGADNNVFIGANGADLAFYQANSLKMLIDTNSRISLSNNDASGAVGTTLFGKSAGLNIPSGAVDNTFIGHEVAGANTITSGADSNTGVGFKALSPLTSGTANTMIGYRSGFNISTGSYNTALGNDTLKNCNDGTYNVAIGRSANEANAGDYNVAVGALCLINNTASNNTAIGYGSAKNVTTSTSNTALGYNSLGGNVSTALTGNDNIALGANAGRDIQGSAEANILIGKDSGIALTTGNFNVLIGRDAGDSLVDETHNTAIGTDALGGSSLVDQTVIIGSQAGAGAMEATADGTVCVGYESGAAITSGAGNVAVGFQAGKAMTSQSNCTLIGYQAGLAINNDNAANSTLIGYKAGVAITDGKQNTAVGVNALLDCTSADYNVAVGNNALENVSTGANNKNTGIGFGTGATLTTGLENTILGTQSDVSASDATNQIVLGVSVTGSGNGTLTFGHGSTDTTCTNGGTTWSNPSDERIKKDIQDSSLGLSFIKDLKPKTFKYRAKGDLPEFHSEYEKGSSDLWREDKTYHGFIAQEVKEAIDKAGDSVKDGFEGWSVNAKTDLQRVGESAFIGALIKAVQELSERVEELESK